MLFEMFGPRFTRRLRRSLMVQQVNGQHVLREEPTLAGPAPEDGEQARCGASNQIAAKQTPAIVAIDPAIDASSRLASQ